MVDRRGIEPRPEACKATVLPLSLSAQIKIHYQSPEEESNPLTCSLSRLLRSGKQCILIWCPRRDSNSQNLVSKTSTYTNSVTRAIWLRTRESNSTNQ